jgi:hypothetical protein
VAAAVLEQLGVLRHLALTQGLEPAVKLFASPMLRTTSPKQLPRLSITRMPANSNVVEIGKEYETAPARDIPGDCRRIDHIPAACPLPRLPGSAAARVHPSTIRPGKRRVGASPAAVHASLGHHPPDVVLYRRLPAGGTRSP